MSLSYMLVFARFVVGMIFFISFIGKALSLKKFQQTISNFNLLPNTFSAPLALIFLMGELFVVILLIVGGSIGLRIGFALALVMLIAFTLALISVLVRKIQTSCNCFGSSEKIISPYDLIRNMGIIIGAAVGLLVADTPTSLDLPGWVLIGVSAGAFVFIWLSTRDIFEFVFSS